MPGIKTTQNRVGSSVDVIIIRAENQLQWNDILVRKVNQLQQACET